MLVRPLIACSKKTDNYKIYEKSRIGLVGKLSLVGKNAIVTGATSGIGYETNVSSWPYYG